MPLQSAKYAVIPSTLLLTKQNREVIESILEIIEDQAISACKYNNDNILIHCTIENGILSFLVKSSNDKNSLFVIDYLKKNIN